MSSKDSRTVEKSRVRESRQEQRNYAPTYQHYRQADQQVRTGYQGSGGHTGTGGGRQQAPQGGYSTSTQAPTYKSGHMEVDSLYSGQSGSLTVNSMNAPNNSTLQCGCENIDCPFCNQMLSIQMSGGQ